MRAFLLALALTLPALLCACQARVDTPSPLVVPRQEDSAQPGQHMLPPKATVQGRVSPVYEQWLYRQSMLASARELLAGLPLERVLWRHSAAAQDKNLLRKAAPTWVFVSPSSRFGTGLAALEQALPLLAGLHVQGVWLGQANETDTVWVPESAPAARRPASLSLDPALGSQQDLAGLLKSLQGQGLQSGMAALSAATGLGPDFFLQARGSAREQGLYTLWDIPGQHWSLLPQATDPFAVQPLDSGSVQNLRAAGVLPPGLFQDTASFGGYAITGPVLGMDGQTRRFAYRFAGTVWQPVLDWQHPGGLARQVVAASVLQTTGVRRQTLCGLDMTALAGLDVAAPLAQGQEALSWTPWPQALDEAAGLVRRCGGWSLALGLHSLQQARLAHERCDFVELPGLAALVQEAIDSGDATPLARTLRDMQALPLHDAVAFAPDIKAVLQLAPGRKGGTTAVPESRKDRLARLVHLSQALAIGLPGLCVLDAAALTEREGGGSNVRPTQAGTLLAEALRARNALDLGTGRLVKVVQPAKGLVVIVTKLPGSGFFVTALNFADAPVQATLSLPSVCGKQADGLTPFNPHTPQASCTNGSLGISLQARQAAHYLAGATTGR